MVERDDRFPPFEELMAELGEMRSIAANVETNSETNIKTNIERNALNKRESRQC